ncbi:MAG: hypothetical protein OJF59_000610 [Cytophagales bacterium]|jgi:hypothetical protein|nr:MAG: hypothetical protein OJF59_000610 [Cytophagales bacterium]
MEKQNGDLLKEHKEAVDRNKDQHSITSHSELEAPSAIKRLFIKTMERAINNERLDEKFFCRPDCIGNMWLLLNKNYSSVLFDPFIDCLETFLVEVLTDCQCDFEWCYSEEAKIENDEIHSDHLKEITQLREELKLDEEFVKRKISIKDIALEIKNRRDTENRRLFTENTFVVEPSVNELIRLLMYRVMAVLPDDYNEQGFLE